MVGRGLYRPIFAGSVHKLHQDQLLDLSVIHGDGTTAAKKGGDNLDYSGHRHFNGDKVVVFCDRGCSVIAPFVSAPGKRNESPLLRDVLPNLTRMASAIGLDLSGLGGQSGRRPRLSREPQGHSSTAA